MQCLELVRRARAAALAAVAIPAVLLLIAGPATATVAVLEPIKDNTLYEYDGTVSNGAGPELLSGLTGVAGLRRALLEFDVAGNVPSGATINSVTLRLISIQAGPFAAATDVYTLDRLQTAWGEAGSGAGTSNNGLGSPALAGDATWTFSSFNTVSWGTAGGDLSGTTSSSAASPTVGVLVFPSTAQLVADVSDMLANAAGNFGWALLGEETISRSARLFHSRESLTPSFRPQLTIDYSIGAGTVVMLNAIRDNTLYQYDPTVSNGSGPELFSGLTGVAGPRRALLAFDIAGNIPAGSTILNASLDLIVLQAGPVSGPADVSTLHGVTGDWGEAGSGAGTGNNGLGSPALAGDATWTDNFYLSSTWTTAGGDFVATASASVQTPTLGGVTFGPTAGLAADVADMLANPGSDFGWMLLTDELISRGARRWSSRETLTPAFRPTLTVEYLPGSGGARGAIADGDDIPGAPLTVGKLPLGDVQLDWSASCRASDTDYGVYEGQIGNWYSHGPVVCSTAGAVSASLTPAALRAYYLVVPNDGTDEGSYGDDSAKVERPPAGATWYAQDIGAPVCP